MARTLSRRQSIRGKNLALFTDKPRSFKEVAAAQDHPAERAWIESVGGAILGGVTGGVIGERALRAAEHNARHGASSNFARGQFGWFGSARSCPR